MGEPRWWAAETPAFPLWPRPVLLALVLTLHWPLDADCPDGYNKKVGATGLESGSGCQARGLSVSPMLVTDYFRVHPTRGGGDVTG